MIDSLSPPTGEARTRWLRLLADARVRVGPHFLCAPAILGDEVCFPDPFRPTQLGATRLLRRMLAHASRVIDSTAVATFTTLQEETSTPKTTDGATTTAWHGAASRLWLEDDSVFLEVESSIAELPDVLLDELAFVVTRLWLGARGVAPDHDVIVATAVALGFGALLLQGTWVIEQGGETRGYFQTTWQRVSSSRRATPGEFAFLIANWARTRGVTNAKPFATHLRDNQLVALKAAFAAPSDAGFNGPVVSTWPLMSGAIAIDDVLVPAFEDEADAAADESNEDNEGVPVFRVIDRRIAGPLALCVVLMIPIGFAMAWLHHNVIDIDGNVAVVVLVGWLVVGMVVGWRNVVDICSDPACRQDIEPHAQQCPGCGRLLGGRIASANDRLRAEEEWLAARHAPAPTTSAALFAVPRR